MLHLHVPKPNMSYVSDAGQAMVGFLPPPGRLAFYGGLGLAAVVGVLDWPVAAAIGIGAVVARRTGQARSRRGTTTRVRSPQERATASA
jgi:hypothetical protein